MEHFSYIAFMVYFSEFLYLHYFDRVISVLRKQLSLIIKRVVESLCNSNPVLLEYKTRHMAGDIKLYAAATMITFKFEISLYIA